MRKITLLRNDTDIHALWRNIWAQFEFRRARHSDIPDLLELLRQVNLVHYEGRPDLFNTVTKYSESELFERIDNVDNPVFVAVSSADEAKIYGHCFCISQDHTAPSDRLFTDIKHFILRICAWTKMREVSV